MIDNETQKIDIDEKTISMVGGFIRDPSTNTRIFVNGVLVTNIKKGIGKLKSKDAVIDVEIIFLTSHQNFGENNNLH